MDFRVGRRDDYCADDEGNLVITVLCVEMDAIYGVSDDLGLWSPVDTGHFPERCVLQALCHITVQVQVSLFPYIALTRLHGSPPPWRDGKV